MAIDPEQFLRYWRFSAPPFPSTMAEQEGAALPPVFIPQPWFRDEVVGDPQRPQSCAIYARRGMGKSAHRLELERMAGIFYGEPALVVVIDEREAMPPANADMATYVAWLCRRTLDRLDQRLLHQPTALAALQREDPRSYDLLWLYWDWYAPAGTYGRPPPSPHSERLRGQVIHNDGPRYTLRLLADLVRALKFASVYVLLDSLDEGLDQDGLADLAERLRPLTSSPSLLHSCGFAFKFFLPSAIRPLLNDTHAGWLHRMREYTIMYSDAQFQQILNRRLEASSRYGATIDESYVNRFAQLCVPSNEPESAEALRLEALILAAAEGSPRTLLRLANLVIQRHCDLASQPGEPIGHAAVESAIKELLGETYQLSRPAPAPAQPQPPEPAELAIPAAAERRVGKLCFFDDGRVTIDDLFVTRLSGKLYLAMQILWANRGHLVKYTDFEAELYHDDYDIRADTKSSREKLIRRLRAKIEEHNPDATVSRTYIDVTEGIGLALRNYGEPDEHTAS